MVSIFGGTDIGLVRQQNQDRFAWECLTSQLSFAVLCDGMGGQKGGGVAAETVTRFASDMLRRDLKEDLSELSIRSILFSAVAGANSIVYETAAKDHSLKGMGTTCILAVFLQQTLYVAYVGDSRVYAVSKQNELQLTKDHTVVQMLVDIGEITQLDALSHPKRHYITRAVGVADYVEPDFLVHSLEVEDIVLICSDGLYNYMAAGNFYPILENCVSQNSTDTLIGLAKAGGGSDNITAVLAKVAG